MTIGFWGPASAAAAVFPSAVFPTFPGQAMFPIIPHHVASATSSEKSLSLSSSSPRSPKSPASSSSPPSPAPSPILSSGGCFRIHTQSPAASGRATSTPKSLSCPSPPPPRRSGVVAAEDIPLHASTKDFRPAGTFDSDLERSFDALSLRLSAEGHLEAEGGERWVRAVRLADDCHSVNLQVQKGATRGFLRVRAVRPVSRGHQLHLWFADELLADLELPFLAPHNIQGEKRYVCHRCGRHYEFPNPLKLHLSLDCGRQARDELWRRLALPAYPEHDKTSAFRPYDSGVGSLSSSLSSSTGSASTSFHSLHHFSLMAAALPNPAHRLFLPGAVTGSVPSPRPPFLPAPLLGHPHPPQQQQQQQQQRPQQQQHQASISSYHQHASDMETLVSNLGRSKQGHLCIYCGKVYSRKYGLKIHIRTHTGFKPLKCKYCLRPFGDPSNLNKHVRLHAEGDTPYKCDLCGKVLVRRRDLERHIKSRHQEGADWDHDAEEDVDVDVDDTSVDTEDSQQPVLCNGSNGTTLGESRAIPTV